MPDRVKKTRAELKALFGANAVPSADDFAALIDANGYVADDSLDILGKLKVDSITSKTEGQSLTLSSNGTDAVEIDGRLQVGSIAPLTSAEPLVLSGGASGGQVRVTSPLTVTGALNAQAGLTVTGGPLVVGTQEANSSLTVNGDVTVDGVVTVQGTLILPGSTLGGTSISVPEVTATQKLRTPRLEPVRTGSDADLILRGNGTGRVRVSGLSDNPSWTLLGSGADPVKYYKDALGYVHLRGTLDSDAYRLPQNHRPVSLVTLYSAGGKLVAITADGALLRNSSENAKLDGMMFIAQERSVSQDVILGMDLNRSGLSNFTVAGDTSVVFPIEPKWYSSENAYFFGGYACFFGLMPPVDRHTIMVWIRIYSTTSSDSDVRPLWSNMDIDYRSSKGNARLTYLTTANKHQHVDVDDWKSRYNGSLCYSNWNHIAMVVDGDNGTTLYVNGKSRLSGGSRPQIPLGLTLGSAATWPGAWINKFYVLGRALTASEIATYAESR